MNSRCAGFTLVEVLVALTLTSIVLAALYSAFFTAERAIGSAGDRLERLHEARMALDMLKREVEAALPYYEKTDRDRFVVLDRDLYGSPASRLSFTTPASVLPGPAQVSYYVIERDGKRSLMKRVGGASQKPDAGVEGVMEAEIVAEIVSFEVEARAKSDWTRTWQENTLPNEVRITLTIPISVGRELTMSIGAVPRIGRKA